MRELRPQARRDARRAAFRLRYQRYITSPRWWRRRERWLDDHLEHTGTPPACAVCDRPWTLADDLHHVTYTTLGSERHHDLLPMCRNCHEDLHQILDHSKHWRTINHATATHHLITLLAPTPPRPRRFVSLPGSSLLLLATVAVAESTAVDSGSELSTARRPPGRDNKAARPVYSLVS